MRVLIFFKLWFSTRRNTLIENVKKVKSRNILKIDLKTNKIDSFEYFNLNKTKNTINYTLMMF